MVKSEYERITYNFAESLQELAADVNIGELAASVNISVPVIYRYLRRESVPSLCNAIAIATHFGCSLDFLFGLTDKRQSLGKNAPPFCEAFRGILKERNCTRYRLQKDTAIPSQSIDDWYAGKRVPAVPNLIKAAEYLGCTLDELTGRG